MSPKVLHHRQLSGCCLLAIFFLSGTTDARLSAQNLVPNGSFEQTERFEYDFPFSAFGYLTDWKAASFQFFDSTLLTTPDLFINGGSGLSPWPITFWNVVTGASHGANYVGLTNIATQDGAFLPETIAAVLIEPLETGAYYTLNLDYRNKGRDNIIPDPMMCIEEELKKLVFYFDDQPIWVSLNQVENTSISSTNQSIELRTASMELYEVTDWENIGTCFQAVGNEKNIALSMTPGRVAVYPPCVILDEYFDLFLHYYFDVDNLRLEKLPERFNLETVICEGQTATLNLQDSLNLPSMRTSVYFTFNGEEINDVISINRGGQYLAYAHLDCTTIPINITVTELDCQPDHFAPNVFSPNFDGVNDEWNVFLKPGILFVDFSLTIFDRWGAVVFETQDATEGWSGENRNFKAAMGTYTWVVQYTFIHPARGPIPQLDSGDLLLIR